MPYTVTKLLIWMILAFLLGIAVGWALRTLRAKRDVAAARAGATGAIERPANDETARSSAVTVVEPPSDETVSEPIEPAPEPIEPAPEPIEQAPDAIEPVSEPIESEPVEEPAVETAAVVGGGPASGGVSDEIVHQREQMDEYEAELEEISAELDRPDNGAPDGRSDPGPGSAV